jgi:hypothetical protein
VTVQPKKAKKNQHAESTEATAPKKVAALPKDSGSTEKVTALSEAAAAPSRRAFVRTEEEELHNNANDSDIELVVPANEEESAGDELSAGLNLSKMISIHRTPTERLMKEWNSQVYAFFHTIPKISEQNGRRAHEFRCQAKGCKATVRHYLDKGDARSTENLRKHVRSCWGEDILKAADEVKDVDEVRKNIVGSVLRNGSITASFERKGKGKITYSHRQHTRAETMYGTLDGVLRRA